MAQTSKKFKTHIHTNHPGKAMEIALEYGPLEKMKIENLDDDWYVVVEPVDEYTNNRAWIENKCMDIINTLVEDDWFDDFDDDNDDDWFDDDDEEDDDE